MESKALVKSTNSNVACKFFALTPSKILRVVYIFDETVAAIIILYRNTKVKVR